MTKDREKNVIHQCSFCGEPSTKVEYMVKSRVSDATICNKCIVACNVTGDDWLREFIDFSQLPRGFEQKTKDLRPITKIPKGWVICAAELYRKSPNVTACSPDGNGEETFSIPKALAYWILNHIEKMDYDKLKKDIKEEISINIRRVLSSY